jgi:hypothetical protein
MPIPDPTDIKFIIAQININTMRNSSLLYLLLSATLISLSSASINQKPVMDNLGPALPPDNPDLPPYDEPTGEIILTDVLGRDRSINVFAGFTRDISDVDQRLGDSHMNTTVLAPLNSAIMALPRKPWEDPQDYAKLGAEAYEGTEGEDRAHRNLRRFVEAHVVPMSPWAEKERVATMAGGEVWWEMKDGMKLVSEFEAKEVMTSTYENYRSSQETLKFPVLEARSRMVRFGSSRAR